MRKIRVPTRVAPAVALTAVAVVIGVLALPVAAEAQTSFPSITHRAAPSAPTAPEPSHLALEVTLGGLHVTLDVPLVVGGLLAPILAAPTTPAPVPAPTTSTISTPPPAPGSGTPSRGTNSPQPRRSAIVEGPRAPTRQGQPGVNGPTPSAPASPRASRPVEKPSPTASRVLGAPDRTRLLRQGLPPSLPLAILIGVVVACALGTAFVVQMAGRRRPGSPNTGARS